AARWRPREPRGAGEGGPLLHDELGPSRPGPGRPDATQLVQHRLAGLVLIHAARRARRADDHRVQSARPTQRAAVEEPLARAPIELEQWLIQQHRHVALQVQGGDRLVSEAGYGI